MRQTTAAIEFGTSKIICCLAEADINEYRVLGMESVDYDGFGRGEFCLPENLDQTVSAVLAETERQANRKIKSVFIGVPAEFSAVVINKVRTNHGNERVIKDADVERLLNSGDKRDVIDHYKVLHKCPLFFGIDNESTMEPIGRRATALSAAVSYLYADMGFTRAMRKLFGDMGIAVRGFLSVSLGQALTLLKREQRDATCVLIDCGYSSTAVMVIKGEGLAFHTNIPIGGRNITNDISLALNINQDHAEQLKRRCIFGLNVSPDDMYEIIDKTTAKILRYPTQAVNEVMQARIEELCDIIMEALEYSKCVLPEKTAVYITGGGIAMIRGIKELMSVNMDMQVNILSPKGTRLNKPLHSAMSGLLGMTLLGDTEDEYKEAGFFAKLFGRN